MFILQNMGIDILPQKAFLGKYIFEVTVDILGVDIPAPTSKGHRLSSLFALYKIFGTENLLLLSM